MYMPILIHDWRDVDYYLALKEESCLTRYAWEFCRRNPGYQADYETFSRFPDTHPFHGVKNGKWKGTPWQGARFYEDAFFYTNPTANPGELYENYVDRCPIQEILPYAQYLSCKYHIVEILDPCFDFDRLQYIGFHDFDDLAFNSAFPPWQLDFFPMEDWDYFKSSSKPDRYEVSQRYIEKMMSWAQNSPVILAFDPRQAIDKQLAEAKAILIEASEQYKEEVERCGAGQSFVERPNLILKKYHMYLKILDVIAECGDGKEALNIIAKLYYPHNENSYNNNVLNNSSVVSSHQINLTIE
jgi:hypothetical protein